MFKFKKVISMTADIVNKCIVVFAYTNPDDEDCTATMKFDQTPGYEQLMEQIETFINYYNNN